MFTKFHWLVLFGSSRKTLRLHWKKRTHLESICTTFNNFFHYHEHKMALQWLRESRAIEDQVCVLFNGPTTNSIAEELEKEYPEYIKVDSSNLRHNYQLIMQTLFPMRIWSHNPSEEKLLGVNSKMAFQIYLSRMWTAYVLPSNHTKLIFAD